MIALLNPNPLFLLDQKSESENLSLTQHAWIHFELKYVFWINLQSNFLGEPRFHELDNFTSTYVLEIFLLLYKRNFFTCLNCIND